jgi:glutamyl-tRNA synthetase
VRDICEELDIKPGLIINAVRTAATGQSAGPGLFEIIVTIGKEKTIERIRKAVDLI